MNSWQCLDHYWRSSLLFTIKEKRPAYQNRKKHGAARSGAYQPPDLKTRFLSTILFPYGFLLFWGIASLVEFSIAGEKMPGCGTIAVPFSYGRKALGELVDSIPGAIAPSGDG
jgi:hypothetical protein